MIQNKYLPLYLAWLVAVVSTAGSLYFSNVLGYPPCDLCWWQRVFTYPMVPILFVGLWKKDTNVSHYILLLAAFGAVVAVYHNLIYEGIIPEIIATCTNGISCKTQYFELFDFVSIPMLSLLSYIITVGLCIYSLRIQESKK